MRAEHRDGRTVVVLPGQLNRHVAGDLVGSAPDHRGDQPQVGLLLEFDHNGRVGVVRVNPRRGRVMPVDRLHWIAFGHVE